MAQIEMTSAKITATYKSTDGKTKSFTLSGLDPQNLDVFASADQVKVIPEGMIDLYNVDHTADRKITATFSADQITVPGSAA